VAHAGRNDAYQDLVIRRFGKIDRFDRELPLGLANDGGTRLHPSSS
jgi:hypothetical protein